jgi:hypothetical protein
MDQPDDQPLSDRERARVERRDKRRRPGMVVDNASVKRVTLALAQRRRPSSTDDPPKDQSQDR